jgi:phage tail sheath gpL-like
VEFLTIPLGINLPGQYIEFDNSRAVQGTPAMPNKILVLAQKLATGTAASNVPVQIPASGVGPGLFGRGSMMTRMLAAIQAVNPYTPLWAIPLDDNGAGVAATGSVKFTAVATAAGTFNLYIGGQLVQIAVSPTQTLAQLATALAAAITADPDLPVTAAVDGVDTTKVDLTYNHKGLVGNDLDLRVNYYPSDALPPGLTYAITAMTGGTTAPSLTAAIAAMGDDWYNHVIAPYNDGASLTAI